jgi:hypothetical protein
MKRYLGIEKSPFKSGGGVLSRPHWHLHASKIFPQRSRARRSRPISGKKHRQAEYTEQTEKTGVQIMPKEFWDSWAVGCVMHGEVRI